MNNDDRIPRESLASRLKVIGAAPGAKIEFCARPNQLKVSGDEDAVRSALSRLGHALAVARPDLTSTAVQTGGTATFTWRSA